MSRSIKYALPLLALAGLVVAITAVVLDDRQPPAVSSSESRVPRAPYPSFIAGAGVIESSSGNISAGTPVSGIVDALYVRWGDHVNTGDPLFKIDDRDLQSQLSTAAAEVKLAEAHLAKSKYMVQAAEALRGNGGMSEEEIKTRGFQMQSDQAALAAEQAELEQLRSEIERRTVRAPVNGTILRIGVHPGEFAQSGLLSTPLIVLGDLSQLHVRVDVDEYDAWRFRSQSAAQAFTPGNPAAHTALRFERVEPLVVPKTALTGDSAERTDTRVLQVIYSFDQAAMPVYVGQQVDVFIQAPPIDAADSPGARSNAALASRR
jgi:HlyD family secretion protein